MGIAEHTELTAGRIATEHIAGHTIERIAANTMDFKRIAESFAVEAVEL